MPPPEPHIRHTIIRITIHGVETITCTGCALSVRRPAGMPDYRDATMATWKETGPTP